MANITCCNASCLEKNEYLGAKPKFCPHCATPYDAAFKRPTPTFVAPASQQPAPPPQQYVDPRYAQQAPQRHVGQYHQPYPYQPGPNDIVLQASDIQLDPASVRIETDRPHKLTVGEVAKGGGGEFGGRAAADERGVNPEGKPKFGAFQDSIFADMRKDLNPQQAQPRSDRQPAQSRTPRSRKKQS